MSIVVAVSREGRTVMAADTQSNFGAKRLPPTNQKTSKIRRVGDSLLGRTGWGIYENILDEVIDEARPELGDRAAIFRFFNVLWKTLHKKYAFVNDQPGRKESPFGDLGASFVVANAGGIFLVAPNTGVARLERFHAIGSGADFALGALHQLYDRGLSADELARAGVETGIVFNAHCGGEIELMEV